MYTGAHRCNVTISMTWLSDAAGTQISAVNGTSNNAAAAGGVTLDGYARLVVRGQAPANAKYVWLYISKYHTFSGQGDSWCFMNRPMFSEIGANSSQMVPWSPPGTTLIQGDSIMTNSINANRIAANTITATQIAGSTITGDRIAGGTITAGNIATDTITAGQIASGAITTSELATGAITASKIAVSASNLITDSQFKDYSNWWCTNFGGTITGQLNSASNGSIGFYQETNAAALSANGAIVGNSFLTVWSGNLSNLTIGWVCYQNFNNNAGGRFAVTSGALYELKVGCQNPSNIGCGAQIEWFDTAGTYISQLYIGFSPGDALIKSVQGQAPATAAWARVALVLNNSSSNYSGWTRFGNLSVREAVGGTMIVDGSITAS